jgi:hypothetical protein
MSDEGALGEGVSAHKGKMRNAYRNVHKKSEGKRPASKRKLLRI